MNGSTNRAGRRSARLRRAKTTLLAGAASAAMTVGLAVPEANAAIPIDVNINPVYTAGALAGLLNLVGPEKLGTTVVQDLTVDLPEALGGRPLTVTLVAQLALYLDYLKHSSTQSLYNTVAALPQQYTGCGGKTLSGASVTSSNPASTCRLVAMLGTSGATLRLANAYSAEIASVADPSTTPNGFIPFEAAPGSTAELPTETNQLLAFLQNPLRPNGGWRSRFPELSRLLGQDPEMPAAGLFTSPDGAVTLNTTTVDATWAYDPKADFPVVFNITAILNSLAAVLPINLAGGLSTQGLGGIVLADQTGAPADPAILIQNLAGLFQIGVSGLPLPNVFPYNQLDPFYLPMSPGEALYATIVPNQLPLLSYVRLPAMAGNALLGALGSDFRLGMPVINALEPALKILANIGYDDVIAPDELDAVDPNSTDGKTYAEEGYQAYDRTFLKAGESTAFGSVKPLTKEERRQVPGDVLAALRDGFREMFSQPLWGFVVPASSTASSTASVAASRVAAPAAAQHEPSVPTSTDGADSVPAIAVAARGSHGAVRAERGNPGDRSGEPGGRKQSAASAAPGSASKAAKPGAAAARHRGGN